MRIPKTDGAEGTRLPSWRPPQVAQLTAEAKQVVTVVVSEQVRALTATLTRSLSDLVSLRLQDALTSEDRLLIAWASELAQAEGIDVEEVARLTSDLARYRAQELVRAELPRLSPGEGQRDAVLSLARFTPREEAQARAILFGLATTQSTIDSGFVNALLDPDVVREGGVSLGFVQRVVAALPPGKSESLAVLDVVFARRDARASLVSVLDRLALPARELRATPEHLELGDEVLRERARLVTPRSAYELLTVTTRNERTVLGLLYASQEARGGDLRRVDDVARALVALRSVGAPNPAPATSRTEPPRVGMHLAAKAAVAYRSVAPPRPNSVPPPILASLPPPPALRADAPPTAAFNLAQALGLSSLVAEAHTLRTRRRRFVRGRRGDEPVEETQAAREAHAEAEEDPHHAQRRHARWRRVLRRRQ